MLSTNNIGAGNTLEEAADKARSRGAKRFMYSPTEKSWRSFICDDDTVKDGWRGKANVYSVVDLKVKKAVGTLADYLKWYGYSKWEYVEHRNLKKYYLEGNTYFAEEWKNTQ